ncbi:MAG: antitoxin [Candidatus Marinimicrobia bacterium]|nr:antitoxin [Candidatus Neomarinimicrobiota bacterium]
MNNNLNKEEQDILTSFENDEWISDPNFNQRKKILRESARYTIQKNKRVNIRISERDIIEIKRRAAEEGLPYQTLISSILHKYISGRLVTKS